MVPMSPMPQRMLDRRLEFGTDRRPADLDWANGVDCEKAKEWQAKAIDLAAKDKLCCEDTMKGLLSRLELYKQGEPYREELKKRLP